MALDWFGITSKQKNQTTYSPKTKLPTNYKTKKHKCAHCQRSNASQYHISGKETRWLCPICVKIHNNSNSKEKPHFIRASSLWRNGS